MTDDSEIEGLRMRIPQYSYGGRDAFLGIMEHELSLPLPKNDVLLFTISDHQFQRDFLHSDETTFSQSWKEYSSSSHSLLVKMLSGPHEQAHLTFIQIITETANSLGISDELLFQGGRTQHLNTTYKQADSSIVPVAFAARGHPTVAIEVALSESNAQLHRDAENWLRGSQGQVQSVITILIKRNTRDLVIRRWIMQKNALFVAQEVLVNVQLLRTRSQDSFTVTGAPFIIPFHHLFLRPPSSNTNEADFQFNVANLIRLAQRTWSI
ncbi:uncharacterized protein N7443_001220 [Penicillium atrosanguineum]|uniref:uncharacterized protein n=1 Tax=Penicillium atrosanguineum TaxID=1132637 RepID=UPI0023A507A6|nr:uncharacterized protein N7443_001220 [Penicillium atrosanguineum]KAJ5314336.1 hypothetical protein N7443_001220 [Penicillium atrosanguineum]